MPEVFFFKNCSVTSTDADVEMIQKTMLTLHNNVATFRHVLNEQLTILNETYLHQNKLSLSVQFVHNQLSQINTTIDSLWFRTKNLNENVNLYISLLLCVLSEVIQ